MIDEGLQTKKGGGGHFQVKQTVNTLVQARQKKNKESLWSVWHLHIFEYF